MNVSDTYEWAAARFDNGELIFDTSDGLTRALADGFFFVQKPAGFDLTPGDCFATNFYLDGRGDANDTYRGFRAWNAERLAEREGYYCRDADQVEQFFLEGRFWDEVFPMALSRQAREMREFSVAVIRAILDRLDLPREILEKATGGILSGNGTYHLTFNHFRPQIRARGLNTHKDSGWITMLRSLEPGLEVLREREWVPLIPRPDAFVMNFGCAIEILTRDTRTPVAAVAHRVVEQQARPDGIPDRFSYALFVDSSLNPAQCEGLYRLDPQAGLVLAADFNTFLDEILANTYDRDTEGLY
ncbi:isopenicillin N synthase family oxygenase [Burkholderia gladioli]|uniref:isopenicillin N synthase family oxygenase n=1 Tax=Burkholderia gladioli TaxID=28095 RepID=UPI00163DFCE2|nr:isopenicillin N synthase family oxygenase [Burkholderia gladioli]